MDDRESIMLTVTINVNIAPQLNQGRKC